MTLLVRTPASCGPERAWVVDVLLREHLGLPYRLEVGGSTETEITLPGSAGLLRIGEDLFPRMEGGGVTPACLPARPLRQWTLPAWCRAVLPPEVEALPVLFGQPGASGAWLELGQEAIHLHPDLFGACFFHLSRMEELLTEARDGRGRFCARNSLVAQEGFAERALVDEWAELLMACLSRLWPQLHRAERSFEIHPSHDVDWPYSVAGVPPGMRIRLLAGDLLLRREPGLFLRRLSAQVGGALDPYDTFDALMDLSEAHGLKSAFNFIAGDTGDEPGINGVYAVEEPRIQRLMRRIADRGHELGLHPSYGTWKDPEALAGEAVRLKRAAETAGVRQEVWGGRMHYLRWEAPTTWAAWEAAGMDYDSTLAWTERVGFRCGTSRPFTAFHLKERRPLRLQERPLIAMDVSLMDPADMGLDEAGAAAALRRVAETCRFFKGTFVVLWHNSSLGTKVERRLYAGLLSALTGRAHVLA
jgi:peptidoglycan/xylan/chitin deacetylase (PgdA/CDA1 family)